MPVSIIHCVYAFHGSMSGMGAAFDGAISGPEMRSMERIGISFSTGAGDETCGSCHPRRSRGLPSATTNGAGLDRHRGRHLPESVNAIFPECPAGRIERVAERAGRTPHAPLVDSPGLDST